MHYLSQYVEEGCLYRCEGRSTLNFPLRGREMASFMIILPLCPTTLSVINNQSVSIHLAFPKYFVFKGATFLNIEMHRIEVVYQVINCNLLRWRVCIYHSVTT